MQTIILPGYSPKNKLWAEEAQKRLSGLFSTSVHYWQHWQTGKSGKGWIETEANKIIVNFEGHGKTNILAKSIATAVAMVILNSCTKLVNKIVLCGVPILDFQPGDEKYYDKLANFPTDRLLCIQNKDDNHGSFKEAKKLLHSINPNINIVSKDRSDHEYPYYEDFMQFLS